MNQSFPFLVSLSKWSPKKLKDNYIWEVKNTNTNKELDRLEMDLHICLKPIWSKLRMIHWRADKSLMNLI